VVPWLHGSMVPPTTKGEYLMKKAAALD